MNHLKSAKDFQRQVDSRLRELEECSFSPKGKKQNIKSKRGGRIDVIVSKRVPWPHDTVLGGSSRKRISYDQLTWCQWVQGFARNILEEKSQKNRENMLHYLSDLMEDANDLYWHGAKAAHAVLMCDMERGAVTWDDTILKNNRKTSCSGAKKPLSSFVLGSDQKKSCFNANVDKSKVKSEHYYRTRIVINSSMKQSDVQSLMAMSKDKAVKMCNKVSKSVVTTRSSCKDFA